VYLDAAARLTTLAAMWPAPPPEQPAAPKQLLTVEGVVIELEETIRTSREETYLGTDDPQADTGQTR
jgi:hypothetical protein